VLTASDVNGVVGIIPTPSTPDADRWDAINTVDLDEAERLTDAVVSAGVDILLTNGTFGEGAALTLEELEAFADVVVRTVAGRIPVFVGATTLNTRDSIARSRRLLQIGADGVFVGRPMWIGLDDAGIVRFYRDLAEALGDVPIVVYDNPSAFKGKISSPAYQGLSQIPQIVAAKHPGLTVGSPLFLGDLKAVEGRIRLLPLETDWYYLSRLFPDQITACWSGNVACGPAPVVALRDLIRAEKWDECAHLTQQIDWALEPLFPKGNFELFMKYSIQLDNAQFQGAGFIRTGPTRPPYVETPPEYLEGGRESGRRWATLQEQYGK
jgi:4-(2-carboxyphenyl)-2-oxobut-3-enoate aldolase